MGSQDITPLVRIKNQRSQDSGFLSHPGWQTHPSPSMPNLRLRGGVGRVSEGDAGQKSSIPLMLAAGQGRGLGRKVPRGLWRHLSSRPSWLWAFLGLGPALGSDWAPGGPLPVFLLGFWSPMSSPSRPSLGGRQPLKERDFQAGLRSRIKSGHEKGSGGEGWRPG